MKAKGTELIFVHEIEGEKIKPLNKYQIEILESQNSEFDLKNYPGSKKLFIASINSEMNVSKVYFLNHEIKFHRSFAVFIR